MKKTFITFAVAATVCGAAFAQSPVLVWEENLGGTSSDIATTIVATPDGGSIVGGYTNSDNGDVVGHKSGSDAWITKLDTDGNVEWKKIYGGDNDDYCYAIIRDAAGDYVFAGTTNSSNGDISSNNGAFDMWVVKINSSGDVLFSKTIGGSDDEAAYGVVQTIDLGYALAGETKTDMIAGVANKGGFDGYLVKVNNSGSTVFQKLVGGSADDGFKAITQTASGELYLAGSTLSNDYDISGNKGGSDYLIARYKSNGTRMWAKTYGGTTNDNAHSITMYGRTPVIAGETESNNGDVPGNKGGDDFWVLRIKATGVTMFSKTFGGETADIARSIVRVPDGFIVAGESESNSMDVNGNYGSSDYWFVKLNNSGNLVYEQNYGGADKDIAYAVARKSDGNFLIAGSSESDNVDVTDNNGNADYWVAYLDNPSARVASSVTEESNAATMFPNPTVGMVTITSATEMTDVVVYDLNGRALISTPVDQFQANIDLSSFPNGIYLAKVMMADGSQQITRIIKN